MQAPSRPAFSRSRGSFPDTRPAWTRFERSLPRPPIDVCAMEVVDTGWWASQGDGSSAGDGGDGDSFGAKAWPSSLAVARFLAEYLGEGHPLPGESESERPVPRQRQTVLELGCGTGIISQTVAAAGGAALATDVSPLALELTRLGWAETSKAAARSARKRDRNFVGEDVAPENGSGTLKLGRFDLMSERALPLPPPDSPPIVVASAVLYERSIAKAVSKRVLEAIEGWDAWVILGDDDTGMRDGGREVLQGELDAYEQRARASGEAVGHVLSRRLSHVTVQNSAFGWKEKPARMLHLNAPEDLILLSIRHKYRAIKTVHQGLF